MKNRLDQKHYHIVTFNVKNGQRKRNGHKLSLQDNYNYNNNFRLASHIQLWSRTLSRRPCLSPIMPYHRPKVVPTGSTLSRRPRLSPIKPYQRIWVVPTASTLLRRPCLSPIEPISLIIGFGSYQQARLFRENLASLGRLAYVSF